jgi:hypothetical protein
VACVTFPKLDGRCFKGHDVRAWSTSNAGDNVDGVDRDVSESDSDQSVKDSDGILYLVGRHGIKPAPFGNRLRHERSDDGQIPIWIALATLQDGGFAVLVEVRCERASEATLQRVARPQASRRDSAMPQASTVVADSRRHSGCSALVFLTDQSS